MLLNVTMWIGSNRQNTFAHDSSTNTESHYGTAKNKVNCFLQMKNILNY